MRVLITGASGFLGRRVVAAAVSAGHDVVALVRPTASLDGVGLPIDRVAVVRGDLRQPMLLRSWFDGADVIVHLAAAASGDLAEQFAGTVLATERLLGELDASKVRRFVHVSSFSVYDFDSLERGATLTESTALETRPAERDAYTTTKLLQEQLVREWCEAGGVPLAVLRPGAVYGPGKDWDYGAALRLPWASFVFAPQATFRLTYVDNCARAIVQAIEAPGAVGEVLNIVDDDLPTHAGYLRLCRQAGAPTGWLIPVPWLAVAAVGRILAVVNKRWWRSRAKLPELLADRRQRARWKPLQYSNAHARTALDWVPETSLDDAVRLTVAAAPREGGRR